jgi:primosomal protein N' (replication factor Y)
MGVVATGAVAGRIATAKAARNRGEWRPATTLPVARVAVDVALAHLDRPFDYAVPEHLDASVAVGVRVRVRFAGRLVDGFVLARAATSDHAGRLAWVEKVVSTETALPPEIAALCRAVADRYGGVMADVLRLAIPPRHARVEAQARPGPDPSAATAIDAGAATDGEPLNDADAVTPAGVHADVEGSAGQALKAAAVGVTSGAGVGGAFAAAAAAGPGGWSRYPRGPAFLRALGEGRAAHAVWQALPGEAWALRLAEAARATAAAGRGAVLVVPDQRDVDHLVEACAGVLGADAVVALTAELGPAERYRRWLAVRRGEVRVVVGTRSAAFAPVIEPGLLCVWDDGDDLHAEPRSPYPNVRDVLVLRAHAAGAALLVAGYARTAEGQLLVGSGWASEIVAERPTVRAAMPRVVAQGESDAQLARDPLARAARLPSAAFEAARSALAAGRPVLVQTPRAGYLPWLSCATCREAARCRHCAGPLGVPGRSLQAADDDGRPPAAGSPSVDPPGGRSPHSGGPGPDGRRTTGATGSAALPCCRWCGRVESAFRCGACGSRRLRAGVVGSRRTAEELGRAFPGVPVKTSGGGAPVLAAVADRAEIVVATPGAEPRAPEGYGAALLLDGWALLARPDLRVAEETLRRWMAAAAAVVPHTDGGRVLVMADPALAPVQALVRWDPVGHAAAELAARTEVGFPPAVRMAAIEGPPAALQDVLDGLAGAVPGLDVLGPVEIDVPAEPRAADAHAPDPGGAEPEEARERALVRVPRAEGRVLAAALHAAQAARTARKATEPVRVRMDPPDVG